MPILNETLAGLDNILQKVVRVCSLVQKFPPILLNFVNLDDEQFWFCSNHEFQTLA
jgi:hypothetical protein